MMALATKLLPRRQVVAYMPNLKCAVRYIRSFSTFKGSDETKTVWPDDLGPFGPQDKRFPLPGYVGPEVVQEPHVQMPKPRSNPVSELCRLLPEHHREQVLSQVQSTANSKEEEFMMEEDTVPRPCDRLEYVAKDCPELIRKDFQDLFPEQDIMHGNFTIVTISQKTINDMTGWNNDVDEEREKLLAAFIEGATEICDALRSVGFWADFIDPSSGKPFLGPHTNSSLFETDERYRKLGFEIEDLGCCKVIRHHIWGTRCYVGCLFTNATLTHPLIETMIDTDLQ